MKSGGSSSGPPTAGAYGNSGTATPAGPSPNTHQFASYLPPPDSTASAQLGDPVVQRFADSTQATPELLQARLAGQQSPMMRPPQDVGNLRAVLAKALLQHDRQRTDALDGGIFGGTNEQRQAILRANRKPYNRDNYG